jgi:peptidoglycan/xylan/chitin deacetylase (PgdA/CDA1 family)
MPKTAEKAIESPLQLRFAFDGEIGDLLERYCWDDVQQAQLSKKFRIYYRLRPFIPLGLRQWLQQRSCQHEEVPNDWYFPKKFANELRQTLTAEILNEQVLYPWPREFQVTSVLTHDVETEEGVRLVLGLASLEEEFGFRSAWNFVPYKYQVPIELIGELRARGHEIGVHGYNHDGRLFESRRTFLERVPHINRALQQYQCNGFRAPMVHRNLQWQQALNIDIDSSCFDQDPFQAMPGGVGSVWPFFAGRFIELPYTLPQDHTLLVAFGEKGPDIWIKKYRFLRSLRGMALLVTHPDYLDTPQKLDVYRRYLQFLTEQKDCWHALPGTVAAWWRIRDEGTQKRGEVSTGSGLRWTNYHELFQEFVNSPREFA